ncbi:hypothetical protein [Actinomadura harenae]|nr:hypothetical protein [Actinomadura harenae]
MLIYPAAVIPLGLLCTLGGAFIAYWGEAFLAWGFYGDNSEPAAFEHAYGPFYEKSLIIAGLLAAALLVVAVVLALVRRKAAQIGLTLCVAAAVATPWVWAIVVYLVGRHWAHAYPL